MKSLVCLVLAVAVFGSSAADETRPVTIDDYGAVETPRSVTLSPDGRFVAYLASDQVHVVPYGGGESRSVTSAGSTAWSPRWSANGDALYFLSDRSGEAQVWKLPVDTFGEAVQLTTLEGGLSSTEFSPDETRIVLTKDDREDEAKDEQPEDAAEEEPFVVDRLGFKADRGAGYLTERPSDHIYTYEIESGELGQVTSGEFTEDDPAWSPDGESIVFVSTREEEPDAVYKTDLWLVSATAADSDLTRLTDDEFVKSSPRFSPDGKSIAYLVAIDGVYGQPELAIMPAAGGESRLLTRSLDRWIRDFRFSADGRYIYFSYEDDGAAHLARLRPDRGDIETLARGPFAIESFDVSDNGRLAATAAFGNRPADVYRVARGDLAPLTSLNETFLSGIALGEKTTVSYASDDGTRVQAFVTTPPGYEEGERYPAILKIHGGPVGQFAWGYDFGTQYLAANGYVVIEPNPRGSSGRGQEFISAIYRTWGITDFPDVVRAVDYLIDEGIADPERLAVTGYSYGGYMTNVVITRDERFRAAASGAGHSFIAANFGHDIYQRWYNWELGPPWEYPERYEKLSPLLDVANVVAPTLFLGGQLDWNVPILNAELFYQSLRVRGIETQLVVYPNAHHGGWPEHFQKDYLERVLGWFDRHLEIETN